MRQAKRKNKKDTSSTPNILDLSVSIPNPEDVLSINFTQRPKSRTTSLHQYVSLGNGSRMHFTAPTESAYMILTALERECKFPGYVKVTYVGNEVGLFSNKDVLVRNAVLEFDQKRTASYMNEIAGLFCQEMEDKLNEPTPGESGGADRGPSPTWYVGLQTQSANQQHTARWNQLDQAKPTPGIGTKLDSDEKSDALTLAVLSFLTDLACIRHGNREMPWRGKTPFDLGCHPSNEEEYTKVRSDLRMDLIKHMACGGSEDITEAMKNLLDKLGVASSNICEFQELVYDIAPYFPDSQGCRFGDAVACHYDTSNDHNDDRTALTAVIIPKHFCDQTLYPKLHSEIEKMGGSLEKNVMFSMVLFGRKSAHDHANTLAGARRLARNATSPLVRILTKSLLAIDSASNYQAIFENVDPPSDWFRQQLSKMDKTEIKEFKDLLGYCLCNDVLKAYASFDKMVSYHLFFLLNCQISQI